MARDNIKAIIERGIKIPSAKAINSKPAQTKPAKIDRNAIAEQPRLRTQVHPHRTLRGTRK
jgi:hypothetical protein